MQWSVKVGIVVAMLAALGFGCGRRAPKTTSRFELEGANGALVSGTIVIDETNQVSIALVDSTNFTFTADKVSYAFTNVGTGGNINVRLFQNEKPQGKGSGTRFVKGHAEMTAHGASMSLSSD
jgi:hypothetical protein